MFLTRALMSSKWVHMFMHQAGAIINPQRSKESQMNCPNSHSWCTWQSCIQIKGIYSKVVPLLSTLCSLSVWLSSVVQFSSVQSLSRARLFVTPWIAARQASLSTTNSWRSPRLTSIESVMPFWLVWGDISLQFWFAILLIKSDIEHLFLCLLARPDHF